MNIEVRAYTDNDIEAMVTIWNQVVEDGVAFPQEKCLTPESGTAFFAEQTYCGVAEDMDTGRIYGMYILHPNNVGRCGHIPTRDVRSDTEWQRKNNRDVWCAGSIKKTEYKGTGV